MDTSQNESRNASAEDESRRKRLGSYKKMLVAGEYETADHLDRAGISPSELQATREAVFHEKLSALPQHWAASYAVDAIRKLQKDLGINDELVTREVRDYCVRFIKTGVQLARNRQGGQPYEVAHTYGTGPSQFAKDIPESFGIVFDNSDIKGLREEGFFDLAEAGGYQLLQNEADLTNVLGLFQLDKSSLESPLLTQKVVAYAARMLEESDIIDAHNTSWRDKASELTKLPFLRAEAFHTPEMQRNIDAWFARSVHAIATHAKENDAAAPRADASHLKQAFQSSDDARTLQRQFPRAFKPEQESSEVRAIFYRLERMFRIEDGLTASAERLADPELKSLLSAYLANYFDGTGQSSIRALGISVAQLERAGFPKNKLRRMAQTGYLDAINGGSFAKATDIQSKFELPESFLESPEIVEVHSRKIKSLVANKSFREMARYLSTASIPKSALHSPEIRIAKQQLILEALLEYQDVNQIRLFVDRLDFGFEPEFFQGQELRKTLGVLTHAASKAFFDRTPNDLRVLLDYGEREGNHLKQRYSEQETDPSEALLFSSLVADLLKNKELVTRLFHEELAARLERASQGDGYNLLEQLAKSQNGLRKLFDIGYDSKELPFQTLISWAERGPDGSLRANRHPIFFNSDFLREASAAFLLSDIQTKFLAIKAFTYVAQLQDDFPIPAYRMDVNGCEREADQIAETFQLTPEQTREGAAARYANMVARGWTQRAVEYAKKYQLEGVDPVLEQKVEDLQETKLLLALRANHPSIVSSMLQTFKPSREFFLRPDVQTLVLMNLRQSLSHESGTGVSKAIIANLTTGMDSAKILAMEPKVQTAFQSLRDVFPALANRVLASIDLAVTLFPVLEGKNLLEILSRFPVLENAVAGNDKHGLKLLFKFPMLDKLSRTNIERLYASKEDTLAENPEIETDSVEFRLAMQDTLLPYRRNEEMLASMRKSGVDTDAWLKYDVEQSFVLGNEGAATSFSEMIAQPVTRIGESLQTYAAAVRAVVGEFEKELRASTVASDVETELRKELTATKVQLEAAIASGDTDRAEKIRLGLRNLEGRIARQKPANAWDTLQRRMKAIDVAFDGMMATKEDLARLDSERASGIEGTPAEKRKFLAANGREMERARRRLVDQLGALNKRFALGYDQPLHNLLAGAMTADWADSVTQDIWTRVAESVDHYGSDVETVRQLLTEPSDKLEGTPMRIALWTRNPDTDLYLGNETDCCIRIDSEHMGAESTIADYLTDLGIQIVAIYDEKRKIPIAVAWCWIGADDDDKVAFVVDNIEANTGYSAPYGPQLTERLGEYIRDYAKSVGIQHVAQGTLYNDLTVAAMDSKYFKVGGYNRPSGYYLEGETSGVEGGGGEDGGGEDWEEDQGNEDMEDAGIDEDEVDEDE